MLHTIQTKLFNLSPSASSLNLILCISLWLMSSSQLVASTNKDSKSLKPVRTALKNDKYKDALTLIAKLRKDSVLASNPKLCLYAIEANRGLNDAENTKIYLKKSYDTLSFFSTTHEIIRECVRLDSIERVAEEQTGAKRKNAHIVKAEVLKYFTNINAAARYYYKQRRFAEAMPYLRTCLDLPHSEMGQEIGLPATLTEAKQLKNSAFYTASAFFSKNYAEVSRYHEQALRDSASHTAVIYYMAQSAREQSDTAAYRQWLIRGWNESPLQKPFFVQLADYYSQAENYTEVLRMSRLQLQADSNDAAALFAMTAAQLHLKHYDEAVSTGLQLMAKDTANVEAWFFVGSARVAQSKAVQLPDNINSSAYRKATALRRSYAEEALPYLEKYRALAPNESKKWAPMLYHVYLTLNKGAKFAEIEKLMQ